MIFSVTPLSRDSFTSDGGGQWRLIGGGNHGEEDFEEDSRGRAGLSGGGFNESYYSDDRPILSEGSNNSTGLSALTSLVRATGLETGEDQVATSHRENSTVEL